MAPPPVVSADCLNCSDICLKETQESVISLSTSRYVPQPLENRSHYVCNRLFVGGFAPGTTAKQLSGVFDGYGKIISCNILPQDVSKNYGFVTFETVDAAEQVLTASNCRPSAFNLHGHHLKIKRAMFRPKKACIKEHKLYRGVHDVVKYYGGPAHFEVLRESIRGYSEFGVVVVPMLPTPVHVPPMPSAMLTPIISNPTTPVVLQGPSEQFNLLTKHAQGPLYVSMPMSGPPCFGPMPLVPPRPRYDTT